MSAHAMHGRRHRGTRIADRPEPWTVDLFEYVPWFRWTDEPEPYLIWVEDQHQTDPHHGWSVEVPRADDPHDHEAAPHARTPQEEWMPAYLTAHRVPVPPRDEGGWWVVAAPGTRIDPVPR